MESQLRRPHELARVIEHTWLMADASAARIAALCAEARTHGFVGVCVNGLWVEACARLLAGSEVSVCAVAGFPLGAQAIETKAFEARRAIRDGAKEIDMVLAIGALKGGDEDLVRRDIDGVLEVCRAGGAALKVILETALLEEREKVRACEIARDCGADFVKTSTGFAKSGATVADVALMRRVVGPRMGVKASGGIRDEKTAREMLRAGATRIGTSCGLRIVGAEPGAPA